PRAPQGSRRRRDLQRRRRAASLRGRRAPRISVGQASAVGAGDLDDAGRAALSEVLDLLAVERASVSSVTDPERAWRVHVDDSLSGLVVAPLAAAGRIADIGSGAGFPGLPLAVALAGTAELDLVESVGRKCDFIRRAADSAGIVNVNVVQA